MHSAVFYSLRTIQCPDNIDSVKINTHVLSRDTLDTEVFLLILYIETDMLKNLPETLRLTHNILVYITFQHLCYDVLFQYKNTVRNYAFLINNNNNKRF